MFKKKKQVQIKDGVEAKFDAMMSLIKDLPKADYNRLKMAMDLGWEAYQKVRNVQTIDEKAVAEIDNSEAELKLIEEIK